MSEIPLIPAPVTPLWDCPECNSTGSSDAEICPVCLGAGLIDTPTTAIWLLDFMESRGCHPDELEQLEKEDPDPLLFALALGICSAIKRSH